MKAIVCREYGAIENLALEEVSDPAVGDNDIGLKILAAGINFPDGLLVKGLYQAKPELPFTPGMELCGEVETVGSNVSNFKPGDRVFCSSPKYGAFAEKVAVDHRFVIPMPADVEPQSACNLLVAHGTAHHALKQRGNLQPGESLVVTGAAGGTGLAAVQIGKAMGARVIAAASSQEKLDLAVANGADATINYSEENLKDAIRDRTDGAGADVIYDPVAGDLFDPAVRAMARNGRFLVIGFAGGSIPKLPINLALVKEFSLVGVFWGNWTRKEPAAFADNMRELMQWYQQGKVSVVVEKTFPLAQTADALLHVMDRKVKGKVAIVM